MITDRTPEDTSNFIAYRNILGTGGSVTDEELEIMLRGSLNNVALNRIENKTQELCDKLNRHQYRVSVNTMNYTDNYKFSITDMNRILNNLNNLKKAYFVYRNTPETPATVYNYQALNDVEKILVDIEDIIADMEGSYRYCGEFECGEE